MNQFIEWKDFEKVELRCGTIVEVALNEKALKPAYILKIYFGENIGYKISSAQVRQNYSQEDLINKKIIAVMNFPPKKVAGVKSEVLVLATVCENKGTLLIEPHSSVIPGSQVL